MSKTYICRYFNSGIKIFIGHPGNPGIFGLAASDRTLTTHEIKQDIDRHSIYIICCSYGKHFADWYSWVGARQQLQITGENSVSIEIISRRTGLDIATGKYLSENI